jgi:hypothetical protein
MNRMTLYHGGSCPVESPEIIESKYAKDFGTGFYCTELKHQAVRWAERYPTPTVSIYSYEPNDALKTLHFPEMTEEWLSFIINCRTGGTHHYDLVIGAMANDQIYNYISDFMNGILTKEQFWILAKFKYPTHQINFCTPNALQCLTYLTFEEV